MRHIMMIAIAISATAPVVAQDVVGAADLRRFEADVPRQSWYPPEYYDVRIAAEGQMAEFPRPRDWWLEKLSNGKQSYNVAVCGDEFAYPDEGDEALARYGDTALRVSRIRSELDALHYPLAVYRDPLLAFERALVTQAESSTSNDMADDDAPIAFDAAAGSGGEDGDADAMTEAEDFALAPEAQLAEGIETNRQKLAPKLPQIIAEDCGGDAAPAPVIVRTVPPGGTVMLVSAFAFKACARKQADPWDRFACRWTEIESGTPTAVRGRNVYQVQWRDGASRRGTRDFDLNYDDDTPTVVTFRKTGG